MPGETLFTTSRTRVRALEPEDGPAAQAMLERCADFFALVYGHPPEPAEAQSLFIGLPEGRTYDDKVVAGIYLGDELTGVVDAIRNHPEPGMWALGLLLFVPEHRGAGLGGEVYEAFERWAAGEGARVIRLVVQDQNTKARAFWERLGFSLERSEMRRQGVLDSLCHIMKRETTSP
jgi:RimJ/RimL family protein N-acetyltransferase